jgi:hypothetical protein
MKFNLELNVYECATLLGLLSRVSGNEDTFRKFTDSVTDKLEEMFKLDSSTLAALYEEIEFEYIAAPKAPGPKMATIKKLMLNHRIAEYTERLEKAFAKTSDLEALQESLDKVI